jgi:hypothetical protein
MDRQQFQRRVNEFKGDYASKGLTCWDLLVTMLFCQSAGAKSLREISQGLGSCEGKLSLLGMKCVGGASTLSYANAHRPWQIYEATFYDLLSQAKRFAPKKKFKFKNKLFSLDSTVIELCCTMFDWAKFRQTKGAIKLHALLDHEGYFPVFAHITDGKKADVKVAWNLELPKGSIVAMDRGYNDYRLFNQWSKEGVFFVTRLKENASYREIEQRLVPGRGNGIKDTLIELSWSSGKETKTAVYRKVVIWLEDKQETLVLLTNQMHLAASTIGAIYKDRWQIELFFKCIKQNLKIKTFVGTSFNAVSIQIWTALISLMLLKLVQWQSRFKGHFSNLIALVRWNLFTYRSLWACLRSSFQDPFDDQRMFHQSFNFGQHPT